MKTEALADLVITALDDLKGVDITTIDVREKTTVTDTLVIASGTSERHVRSLADRVLDNVRAAGMKPLGVEGEQGGDWLLIDLGDVVVHVMLPEKRDFYNLEKLWTLDTRGAAAGDEG
ncbi:MAG: ribosome silencing factor [Halofilum sp. (in: g-proteobacteria)]|nr:ribosome silencing factor [Halofilum sp. (in: g-proteobacteria)]